MSEVVRDVAVCVCVWYRLCAEWLKWLEGEDRRESGKKEVGLFFM